MLTQFEQQRLNQSFDSARLRENSPPAQPAKEKPVAPLDKSWAIKTLPAFTGKKALVLPGAFYSSGVELMARAGFSKADSVETADVVVFMGGVDLAPSTYGDKATSYTSEAGKQRDEAEKAYYDKAVALGKVCFGICRGAQFLHAMNGGKLWQHVENHGGSNHLIYDLDDDVTVMANSYHHQMVIDHKDLEIVAVCSEQISHRFHADGIDINLQAVHNNSMAEMEIEAGAYNKTKCFFVQGHPEVGSPEYSSWCLHRLKDYIEDWTTAAVTRDKHNQLAVDKQLEMWRGEAIGQLG